MEKVVKPLLALASVRGDIGHLFPVIIDRFILLAR